MNDIQKLRRVPRCRDRLYEIVAMKTLALVMMLLLSACNTLPHPFAGADPSDPTVAVVTVRHRPALEGYVSQRPVEPGSWREQNERVAPKQERRP